MSNPKFTREFSGKEALIGTSLFTDKLRADIDKGEVFPAIRNNVMHFYYKGGKLFDYTDKFKTNIKYGFVPDGKCKNYIAESDLISIAPIKNFINGYKLIKDRCVAYCRIEAMGVSMLYKDSAWKKAPHNSDIVLLDIETMFSENQNEDVESIENTKDKNNSRYNHDRFDIVLYNNRTKEIRVFEAKHFSNSELWSRTTPKVIGQIQQYENVIKNRKDEIIDAYKSQIKIMNQIFNKNYNVPKSINEKVGLLLFGFDSDQTTKIKKQYKDKNITIYAKGNATEIEAEKLYNKLG